MSKKLQDRFLRHRYRNKTYIAQGFISEHEAYQRIASYKRWKYTSSILTYLGYLLIILLILLLFNPIGSIREILRIL